MKNTAPLSPLPALNRQYLALSHEIDRRPAERYFQAPIELIEQRNRIRNRIVLHQEQSKEAASR